MMLIRSACLTSGPHIPKAIVVAVACGICAAVAYLAFQTSIRVGKVTIALLTMNLSAGVPAVVSIWKYREKFITLRVSAFAESWPCDYNGRLSAQLAGLPDAEEICSSGGGPKYERHSTHKCYRLRGQV